MKKVAVFPTMLAVAFAGLLIITACNSADSGDAVVSSRSYSGHENDQDSNNFVRAFSGTQATRLDDCQTCHRAGANDGNSDPTRIKIVTNVCAHCHLLEWPDSTYTVDVPTNYYDTLNDFGKAYMNGGRSVAALTAIADQDSDGDGFTNVEEIADNRFPGNPDSKPGQPLAPCRVITKSQLTSMTYHEQLMLMNTTKQQYDDYTNYGGVKVTDFLNAAGVDMTASTGITVFAPDGFSRDHPKDDDGSDLTYDINFNYPHGTFYRDTVLYENSNLLLNCVTYPEVLPAYGHLDEITDDLFLMIAYNRNGTMLSDSYYDGSTGRLEGEGPFRLVNPQNIASRPDRGSKSVQADPTDGYNYLNSLDHNAGSSTRGMCVIRINPMPAGYEEYDYTNGWSLIEDQVIVIYGTGVPEE